MQSNCTLTQLNKSELLYCIKIILIINFVRIKLLLTFAFEKLKRSIIIKTNKNENSQRTGQRNHE